MQEPTHGEWNLAGILANHGRKRDDLIPLLQHVQADASYISRDAVRQIAAHLRVPESEVYGVATFYRQFRFLRPGEHIVQVCRGTACHVRGASGILQEIERCLGISPGETTGDRKFSLTTVACFGSCALSPIMVIDGKVYGRVTAEKARGLLRELQ